MSSKIPTFKGFIIPLEPVPPESDECCMSGCAVCVYDLYEESLEAYNEAVEDLRTKLVAVNIPEDEWPKHIRTRGQTGSNTQPAKSANVVMSAFEEMERRLKEKHPAPGMNATDFNTPVGDPRTKNTYRRPPESRAQFDWKEFWEGIRWLLFSSR